MNNKDSPEVLHTCWTLFFKCCRPRSHFSHLEDAFVQIESQRATQSSHRATDVNKLRPYITRFTTRHLLNMLIFSFISWCRRFQIKSFLWTPLQHQNNVQYMFYIYMYKLKVKFINHKVQIIDELYKWMHYGERPIKHLEWKTYHQ